MAYSPKSTGKVPSYASRRVANPDRVSTKARVAKQKEWRVAHPINYLLSLARCRAKVRGLPFNLEVKDVDAPEFCPVLGFRLKYLGESKKNAPDTATLDRIKHAYPV